MAAFAVLAILLAQTSNVAFGVQIYPSKISKALHQSHYADHSGERIVSQPMHLFRGDCHTKKPFPILAHMAAKVLKLNLTLNLSNPGAGTKLDKIEPFIDMLKDGYSEVACIKDYMYHHGDLHGANKHEYEIKERSNVSIVHYNMVVPKEDQKAMSHTVCFDFCRGVPDMLFFGMTAGRECYCIPFFQMMAGDSSKCDAVCEGEPTTMCGGMAKSTIMEMHLCADTAEDLEAASEKAGDINSDLKEVGEELMKVSESLQDASAAGQKTFGSAGDPAASDLFQKGKVAAGDAEKTADAALDVSKTLGELKEKVDGMEGPFTKMDVVKEAEETIKKIDVQVNEGEAALSAAQDALAAITTKTEDDVLKQYYPIMYFVDKEFADVPQSCSGDLLKVAFGSAQDCAALCDAELSKCSGFFYGGGKEDACFLITTFKSVTYFTECKSFVQVEKPTAFLQRANVTTGNATAANVTAHALVKKEGPPGEGPPDVEVDGKDAAMCYVKFTTFSGTTLKPDPSGKCKKCLKTADKAQRCYK